LVEQHSDTLTVVNNLALLLQDLQKYAEAEKMYRRALAGREKKLGIDHLHTLESMDDLASVLQDEGKYAEAEEVNCRAQAEREKKLVIDHSATLREHKYLS
jgi:tetratricopeptide (TPR) repeat protein